MPRRVCQASVYPVRGMAQPSATARRIETSGLDVLLEGTLLASRGKLTASPANGTEMSALRCCMVSNALGDRVLPCVFRTGAGGDGVYEVNGSMSSVGDAASVPWEANSFPYSVRWKLGASYRLRMKPTRRLCGSPLLAAAGSDHSSPGRESHSRTGRNRCCRRSSPARSLR